MDQSSKEIDAQIWCSKPDLQIDSNCKALTSVHQPPVPLSETPRFIYEWFEVSSVLLHKVNTFLSEPGLGQGSNWQNQCWIQRFTSTSLQQNPLILDGFKSWENQSHFWSNTIQNSKAFGIKVLVQAIQSMYKSRFSIQTKPKAEDTVVHIWQIVTKVSHISNQYATDTTMNFVKDLLQPARFSRQLPRCVSLKFIGGQLIGKPHRLSPTKRVEVKIHRDPLLM